MEAIPTVLRAVPIGTALFLFVSPLTLIKAGNKALNIPCIDRLSSAGGSHPFLYLPACTDGCSYGIL